jgi:chloramphenicol 3-O-phosphotransferase
MTFNPSDPFPKRYAKALCHLNHARGTHRLGIILGSGVSNDLGIPKWKALIEGIETKLGYDSGNAPESYRAEQLFQHYKKIKIGELGWFNSGRMDAAILSGWRETVGSCLYFAFRSKNGKFNADAYKEKIRQHPYLIALGRLARKSQLVVTHNFDDALEVAIDTDPTVAAQPNRRYHSFWRPEPFLRRGMVNIYHPNGFTPLLPGLRGSENLVLTEASFADHLANTNTEESHFFLRHLADKTCLIIGHSLADGTLKNALRQHANQRPGHVNYYVHWTSGGEASLSADQRNAIREANFETYNLITLFANSTEIAEILRILAMDDGELEGLLAHHSVVARYVYYIVGAVSSGKSTMLRNLRDLATVEEWPGNMPTVMNLPSIGLAKTQEQLIDERLEEAIWNKNSEIKDIKAGLVAVDRAPLDFITFPSRPSETLGVTARKRSNAVLERLLPNGLRALCPGQVVVVRADAEVLVERQLQRGGRTTPKEVSSGATLRYLERQRERLLEVYKRAIQAGSVVDTDRCTVAVSVKAVARIIHFGTYTPFDFASRLRQIKKGS